MVVRLFIPPGEGQHHVVPKRPDPLAANATLYVMVASTAVAAGHASMAAEFARRTTPYTRISRTALFVTSSARLGIWAVVAGAAVNAYYHRSFTSVVVAEAVKDPTPAKLWEKTESYTAEDGCIAGAVVGMAAFLPTLFMRRASVPRWTRLLGMMNIGASTGIVASQAYFQYTGERLKALKELDRQRRRRALEFHHIFWNKLLMARFDPLIQQYVRHNGIFRAYHIPAEVYQAPDKYGLASAATTEKSATTGEAAATTESDDRFYKAAQDHAQILETMDVQATRREVEEFRQQRQALLKEAEYMYYELTQKQHIFCHTTHPSEDDRQRQLRELQLMSIAYNRLRTKAEELDRSVLYGNTWLQQKTALDNNSARTAWLSSATLCDPDSHDPTLSIAEMKKFQDQFVGEINQWEALIKSQTEEDVRKREKYKRDLNDARMMLRAADQVAHEMEMKVRGVADKAVKVDEPRDKLEPGEPEKS